MGWRVFLSSPLHTGFVLFQVWPLQYNIEGPWSQKPLLQLNTIQEPSSFMLLVPWVSGPRLEHPEPEGERGKHGLLIVDTKRDACCCLPYKQIHRQKHNVLSNQTPHRHRLEVPGTSAQTHNCWFCIHGACSQDDNWRSPTVHRNGKTSSRSPGV